MSFPDATGTFFSGELYQLAGDTHYIHLLDYVSDNATLDNIPDSVSSARVLHTGESVRMERTDKGVVINVPEAQRDPIDTVVVLS